MQSKQIIRVAVVVIAVAAVITLVSIFGPNIFDMLLEMHGL